MSRSSRRDVRHFPCELQSVADARHFVLDALEREPPEVREAAALVVSELATNAVRHAESDFVVRLDANARIRIEVDDESPEDPEATSTPEATETSGRGLRIVAALAEQWGVTHRPDDGKGIWIVLQSERGAELSESA